MTQDRKTVVGAVEFTAQGVVITKTYNTPDELDYVRTPFDSEKFMSYLQARIDHCEKSLNENIMRATYISEELVLWDGGRFTRRVYEMMVDFVSKYRGFETNFDMLERDPQFKGCCQQVIRHLYDNKIEDKNMFYILTEYVICA
jgi:hypothetical protein